MVESYATRSTANEWRSTGTIHYAVGIPACLASFTPKLNRPWGADIGLVTTRHFERRYEIIGNTCESKMQLRRGGHLLA